MGEVYKQESGRLNLHTKPVVNQSCWLLVVQAAQTRLPVALLALCCCPPGPVMVLASSRRYFARSRQWHPGSLLTNGYDRGVATLDPRRPRPPRSASRSTAT